MTESSNDALAGWAASNGLLGLVLQRTEQVELAPRWMHLSPEDVIVRRGERQTMAKTRIRFARTPTGWTELIDHDDGAASLSTNDVLADEVLSADQVPAGWSQGSALVRDDRDALVLEPIEKAWGSFFPDVDVLSKRSHEYELPLTEEFWASYGEPVGDFLRAALELGGAARWAARLAGMSDAEIEKLDIDSYRAIAEATELLQRLVAPVAPTLDREPDNSLRLHWTGPSLLGLYALMILMDLTSRIRLRSCEECHRLFVSSSPAATFCSDACRWRYQKRAQRKHKHERAVADTRQKRE